MKHSRSPRIVDREISHREEYAFLSKTSVRKVDEASPRKKLGDPKGAIDR